MKHPLPLKALISMSGVGLLGSVAWCPAVLAQDNAESGMAAGLGILLKHPGALAAVLLFAVAIGGILTAVFLWNFALTRKIQLATATIRESEARFKGIFDNAYQAFGLLDAQGTIVEVNSRALEIIGVSAADVKGRPFSETPWWHHSDGSENILRQMLDAVMQGDFVQREIRQVTIGGEKLVVDFSLKPIADEMGRVVNIIAEGRDITELKTYQRALEEQKEDYRSLFENSLAGLYRTRIEDGLFLRANDETARIFGFSTKEDIVNKEGSAKYYVDPNVREELIARALDQGSVKGITAAIVGADGREKYFLVSAKAFSDEGFIEGSIVDITDLKQAEAALLESEAKFRAIVESCPEGIGIADFDGHILSFNDRLLEITGYSRGDLNGKTFNDITPEVYLEEERRQWQALKTGAAGKMVFQKELIGQNGELIPVILTGWLVRNENDAPVAVGGFVRDIRLEKKLAREKAELETLLQHTQKMEAIGTLAGGIAHDFNNILGGIIGYAEIAIDDALAIENEQIQNSLKKALAAGFRAKDLVSQILKFSRREEGERKSVKLSKIVNEVCGLMKATLPSTITFNTAVDAESISAFVDPGQIHQVIMNLCTNAYQAIDEDPAGTIEVHMTQETIRVSRMAFPAEIPPGRYCTIRVSDTGLGMSEDIKARIFDPYFMTKAIGKGTGLGLSVSRGIVVSHGGTISVESAPGKGTQFCVYIPIIDTEETERTTEPVAPPGGSGETILVIDDEAFFVEVAEHILSGAGYAVVPRHSSWEALALFKADPQRFDVVVTDQTMPGLTGVQLSQRIREINTDVPIVLCTGFSEKITTDTAANFNIDRIIMKPVTRLQLLDAVHQTLSNKRGRANGTHSDRR